MKNKLTVVLGASLDKQRYSNRAIVALKKAGFEVGAVGRDTGSVDGIEIQHGYPHYSNVDTVTMYISKRHQSDFYDYILGLNPRRIVFNPGAENPDLEKKAKEQGIVVENACTLVMLSVGNY